MRWGSSLRLASSWRLKPNRCRCLVDAELVQKKGWLRNGIVEWGGQWDGMKMTGEMDLLQRMMVFCYGLGRWRYVNGNGQMMKWRWDGEVRMMDTAEGGEDEMVLRWNGGKKGELLQNEQDNGGMIELRKWRIGLETNGFLNDLRRLFLPPFIGLVGRWFGSSGATDLHVAASDWWCSSFWRNRPPTDSCNKGF